jgi:hypothetical protein
MTGRGMNSSEIMKTIFLFTLFSLLSLAAIAGLNPVLQNPYTTNNQVAADAHVSTLTVSNANSVATSNFWSQFNNYAQPHRRFFVATNGNDATAVTNDPTHPFAPKFSSTSGVLTLATNAGDEVYLLDGTNYQATMLVVAPYVYLHGNPHNPNAVVITQTNSFGIAYPSFLQPGTGDRFESFTYNTTAPGCSFLFAPFNPNAGGFTNVIGLNLVIHGGNDTFYGGWPGLSEQFTLIYSYVDAIEDIVMVSGSIGQNVSLIYGGLTSINNIFVSANLIPGGVYNPSRILCYAPNFTFTDFGSTFYGFGGQGGWMVNGHLHSSIFRASTTNNLFSTMTGQMPANSGDFIDDNGNAQSLNAEAASYYVVSSTSTVVTNYSLTNLFSSGAGSAPFNQNYSLFSAVGDIVNDQANTNTIAEWTNSVNGCTLWLNEPSAVANYVSGYPTVPTWTMESNGLSATFFYKDIGAGAVVGVQSNSIAGWQRQTGFGSNPAPTVLLATNGTSTNVLSTYAPQIFNGAVKADMNENVTFTGNGGGLTNLSVANLNWSGATTFLTNGAALHIPVCVIGGVTNYLILFTNVPPP